MKYFSALADAAFARSAFTAAGLDFEALRDAKNADCLKTALAASGEAVKAEEIISAAKAENDELKQTIENLNGASKNLSATFDGLGFKLADAKDESGKISASKLADQKAEMVTKEARELVAKAGHPGVLDTPLSDPKAKKKEEPKVAITGADRIAADFNRQIADLNQSGNVRNN